MWTDVRVSLLPSKETDGDRWNGPVSASMRGLRRLGMLTVWTSGFRRVARTVSSSLTSDACFTAARMLP